MSVIREAGEDYLEAILQIENENDCVRSVDVANRLGVSRPSVNKAIGILREAGMVEQQPYGDIRLTEQGRERAQVVSRRHALIKGFLVEVLRVEESVAEQDACKMEHAVSDQTMTRWAQFVSGYLENE
ncbi:metal-dependent transcriptional regulator [Hydrogenoanaerobacterium sp.]|uniref:metal-dependent transcriptional regulator n=1 Tax=Hydrogenoanaerobacterium sp. TaxID=2953763 RepID=UPI00289B41C5|nr:metal-dependent transcriptional regulator [Hydrogenoanaerobacterium sp.]